MTIPGGYSDERPPTDEEIEYLSSPDVLEAMAVETTPAIGGYDDCKGWKPVLVATQVVAGTNFRVKYRIDYLNAPFIHHAHATIFRPLPCHSADGAGPVVSALQIGVHPDAPLSQQLPLRKRKEADSE